MCLRPLGMPSRYRPARTLWRLDDACWTEVWDDRSQTAWLVRDRLGVKPLYFVERDGGLAFASTARALASVAPAVHLSDAAVASVLEFGFIPDNLCVYEGMRKVPAGCLVETGRGRQ